MSSYWRVRSCCGLPSHCDADVRTLFDRRKQRSRLATFGHGCKVHYAVDLNCHPAVTAVRENLTLVRTSLLLHPVASHGMMVFWVNWADTKKAIHTPSITLSGTYHAPNEPTPTTPLLQERMRTKASEVRPRSDVQRGEGWVFLEFVVRHDDCHSRCLQTLAFLSHRSPVHAENLSQLGKGARTF